MVEEKTITITYETLFEILRREKDKFELQKLDSGFYNDVSNYLNEKNKLLINTGEDRSDEEKLKTQKQLINIKKILKEIYERREKKIINLALDKSKTSSDSMDTSILLDDERSMFESLVRLLGQYREGVLNNVIESRNTVKVEVKEEPKLENNGEAKKDNVVQEPEVEEKPTKIIRFKHAVPKFLGLEGEEFGPFDEEDIASLPSKIAGVLINKGRVEEIREE